MSTNNDWVLMSERKPTEDELPAWVANTRERPVLVGAGPFWHWTHWKPADIPAPPKEKTQAEKDAAACSEWYWRRPFGAGLEVAWHAALAYERAEVMKLLFPIHSSLANTAAIEAIRARCGGGK